MKHIKGEVRNIIYITNQPVARIQQALAAIVSITSQVFAISAEAVKKVMKSNACKGATPTTSNRCRLLLWESRPRDEGGSE
jgi:hypothetical protein